MKNAGGINTICKCGMLSFSCTHLEIESLCPMPQYQTHQRQFNNLLCFILTLLFGFMNSLYKRWNKMWKVSHSEKKIERKDEVVLEKQKESEWNGYKTETRRKSVENKVDDEKWRN